MFYAFSYIYVTLFIYTWIFSCQLKRWSMILIRMSFGFVCDFLVLRISFFTSSAKAYLSSLPYIFHIGCGWWFTACESAGNFDREFSLNPIRRVVSHVRGIALMHKTGMIRCLARRWLGDFPGISVHVFAHVRCASVTP